MAKVWVKDGKAALVNPETGSTEWVEVDRVPDRLGQGWIAESDASLRQQSLERVYGGTGGEVLTGAMGAMRGASLGLSDILFRGLGYTANDMERYRQTNPASGIVGEVGGMVGGALVPGGPLAQVGRAGSKVRSATSASVLGKYGRGVPTKGVARGAEVAGALTQGAAEGGMVAGALGVTEPLRDPSAELGDMISRAADGAVLGAGFNLAALGVGALARFAGRHARRSAEKAGVKTDNLAASSKELREAEKTLKALKAKASASQTTDDVMMDASMAPGFTPAGAPAAGAPAPSVASAAAPAGQASPLVDDLMSVLSGTKRPAPGQLPKSALAGRKAEEAIYSQRAARMAADDEAAGVAWSGPDPGLRAARGTEGPQIPAGYRRPAPPAAPPTAAEKALAAAQKKVDELEFKTNKLRMLDEADAKRALSEMKRHEKAKLNEAAERAKAIRRVAERSAYNGSIRSFRNIGRAGTGGAHTSNAPAAGALGGIGLGGALGGVVGFLVAPLVMKAAHHVMWNAGKVGAKVAPYLQRIIKPEGARAAITMHVGEYEDIRDELEATPPEKVTDRATMMLPGWLDAGEAEELKADTVRGLSYLHATMPKPPPGHNPLESTWAPPQAELDSWARRIRAAVDAESPARDFLRLQLSSEARDTWQALHPQQLAAFGDWVVQQMTARKQLGENVPYEVLEQASLLTGRPEIGPAIMQPAIQAYLQESYAAATSGGKPKPSGPKPEMAARGMSRLDRAIERTT